MRKDQIPDFVDEITATGCPICAISDDLYVLGEIDVPEEEIERVSRDVHEISRRYGERDHLRTEIAAYLRSIGRYFDLDVRTAN
ncbi:hypothetical protein M0412_03825 [Agrobacterium sp. O3.4]|uniref:Uncharacterized protein n=1 Tax=Agrobacterium cucumeris TaxID=2862866 RepID=A0ABY8RH13_9HYPH|nr:MULTISPECIES: hypothetical protein [Rhizobium/Agrobacterium group]MCZ7469813.1 hypothetical protein [Rhizobium rhizogenes]WHO06966.1 hypothetical protein KZ699_07510 [Agrobacterium cucumeris]